MGLPADLREALEAGDALRASRIFQGLNPHTPPTTEPGEDVMVMHQARTAADSIGLAKRLYSHAWLSERGYKSELPEALRPPAERSPKTIAAAVGVAYKTASAFLDRREEAAAIEKVMARAAGDMVRDGITDRARIAPRMWEARRLFLAGKLRREV